MKFEKKNVNLTKNTFMKKLLLASPIILGSTFLNAFAEENNRTYLSIGGGAAFPADVEGKSSLVDTKTLKFPTNTSGLYTLGIGYKYYDWRVEFNYSKSTVHSDSVKITNAAGTAITGSSVPNFKQNINSYMAFGYKDFTNESKLTPYAGVGLGMASISTKNLKTSIVGASNTAGDDVSVFSFAVKGGFDYEIVENTSLYTELTYQNFSSYDAKESGKATVSYEANNHFAVTTGLKFSF